MSTLEDFKCVRATVLNTSSLGAGWRAQVRIDASRLRAEVATPWPARPGERLMLQPRRHRWSLAPVGAGQ